MNADQLQRVLSRGDQGVRAAVQVERLDGARRRERQVVVLAVEQRVDALQDAVPVHADQLHAVVPQRGNQGVRAPAQVERGKVDRKPESTVKGVGQRRIRLQGAVGVHADQLHGVGQASADEGVRAAAHTERVDRAGAVERAAVAGVQRSGRREGAVGVHADQLHAAVGRRAGNDVRAAVYGKGDGGVGPGQRGEAALVVPGLAGRREGAVGVHADQLQAVVLRQGHRGVRAAPQGKCVDVRGVGERGVAGIAAVAGRAGRGRPRGGVVDEHVVRVGQRAGRARGGQRQAGRAAKRARDAARQGGRVVVVQVVGAVAGPHRVGKRKAGRAVARHVRGRPRRPADVEEQLGRGRPARVHGGPAEHYADAHRVPLAVHAVRHAGGHGQGAGGQPVDGNVARVAERPAGAGQRQCEVGGVSRGRVPDRAAGDARQGIGASIVEVGGVLALPHRVGEHDLGGVVAR